MSLVVWLNLSARPDWEQISPIILNVDYFFENPPARNYVIVRSTPPKKEADRLVREHKIGPKPSTFHRKDDSHG